MIASRKPVEIACADLRTALRGIRSGRAIACGVTLDALHAFRMQSLSTKGMAALLREDALPLGNAKLHGIVDALLEYQLIHPVHHSVLDEICALVERSIIQSQRMEVPWVNGALRLLATDYDANRLRSLVDMAVSPYGLAQTYAAEFLRTVSVYVSAARAVDPEYRHLAGHLLQRVQNRLHEDGLPEYLQSSLQEIVRWLEMPDAVESQRMRAMASEKADQAVRDIKKRLARAISCAKNALHARAVCSARRTRHLLGVGCMLAVVGGTALLRPLIVRQWNTVEPYFFVLQILVFGLTLTLWLIGVGVNKKWLSKKLDAMLTEAFYTSRINVSLIPHIEEEFGEEIDDSPRFPAEVSVDPS